MLTCYLHFNNSNGTAIQMQALKRNKENIAYNPPPQPDNICLCPSSKNGNGFTNL